MFNFICFDDDFREPCDKVHVLNTGDIGPIMVSHIKYLKRKHLYVRGIAGNTMISALNLQNWFLSQMAQLQDEVTAVMSDTVDWNQVPSHQL